MDASVRRSLSALSSLFDALCNANAMTHDPVTGVERPNEGENEGKTPALSDKQVRALLDALSPETIKGKRDCAILAALFESLCNASAVTHNTVEGLESYKRKTRPEDSPTFRVKY